MRVLAQKKLVQTYMWFVCVLESFYLCLWATYHKALLSRVLLVTVYSKTLEIHHV